jgi:hypothetical protein
MSNQIINDHKIDDTNDIQPETNNEDIQEKEIHKQKFTQWLDETYQNKTKSLVISRAQASRITDLLTQKSIFGNANEKFQIIKKQYFIKNNTLCRIIGDEEKKVAVYEDIFDIIHEIHTKKGDHLSAVKTLDAVNAEYYGITLSMITKFRKDCIVCNQKQSQYREPSREPTISYQKFDRIQIDLIHMWHKPDGEYKWIAHVVDQYSHFHVLWPQKTICAEEVNLGLLNRWFSYFGMPKILHFSDIPELKNQTIQDFVQSCNDKSECIFGERPSLVKATNRTVRQMLFCAMAEFKTNKWSEYLSFVMYNMNTSKSCSLKQSPYEIVFNRKPNVGDEKIYIDLEATLDLPQEI